MDTEKTLTDHMGSEKDKELLSPEVGCFSDIREEKGFNLKEHK